MRPGKNGGKLQTGNPGNKGGGRSPNEIRERLRASLDTHLTTLERIASGVFPLTQRCEKCGAPGSTMELPTDAADQLRAIEYLLKFGVGTVREVSVENVRERVIETLEVIRSHCSPEQATTVINALRPVWA